ncbi:Tetratricopeptide repeat-containing protein [Filimonas lacunae]|uniref:Tetratricopeptide repeat-containing protein n=1 Tax=Filimonas lacunae TaxID=477680 RepID=A0A173MFQ9_9BACT|nr:tetratricopeptide repeat protein [Filimonas lacunae]BAV06319.1 hypothetical protein FLA_2335 [Filimonas lacunae]SIT25788.1 Tetratricopeptide repeat-containing protein [Filimonas lacunae]
MSNSGFTEGDIFYTVIDNNYHIFKLLVQEYATWHVMHFAPVTQLPNAEQVDDLEIYGYHAPISATGFNNPVLLAHQPVIAADLIGYHTYLQETLRPEDYIPIAQRYYSTAYEFTNQQLHHEAIDAYSKAIDLLPYFYEAIDNRAFCKMDLGLWDEAIEDFTLSLTQNPESMLAEFSIGECYYKKGEYVKALPYFERAHQLNPQHPAPDTYIQALKALL